MKTLVLIKPDAWHRGIVGRIISRFEEKGLTISKMELISASLEQLEKHYVEHKDKPYFMELINFMILGPVVAIKLTGPDVVQIVRKMVGESSFSNKCSPGTIRGDFSVSGRYNVVHASSSEEQADRELRIWFGDESREEYKCTDSYIRCFELGEA